MLAYVLWGLAALYLVVAVVVGWLTYRASVNESRATGVQHLRAIGLGFAIGLLWPVFAFVLR